MSNKSYLAEKTLSEEETHLHHWVKYIFASWDDAFMGLICRGCEKFIAEENVAKYVNELEKKLKDASQSL